MKRFVVIIGHGLAWWFLVGCLAIVVLHIDRLIRMHHGNPGYVSLLYTLFWLIPLFISASSALLFETWACIKVKKPVYWLLIYLVLLGLISLKYIYLFTVTPIDAPEALNMLKHRIIDLPWLLAIILAVPVLIFYVRTIFKQKDSVSLTLLAGRCFTSLWIMVMTFFTLIWPMYVLMI
jgi:hypothetical protein